jgi:cold shock CspA family protein
LDNGNAFYTHYPKIAESLYGHDRPAAELRDSLSEIHSDLAAKFFTYFQPRVDTVTRAKGYCRITADGIYGDYFILVQEIETAGIGKLRVGDRVQFKTSGRRVLPDHLKLLPRGG